LQGDTAQVLARYGSKMALSGVSIGSPISNPAVAKAVGT
jgi:hypothetical protein